MSEREVWRTWVWGEQDGKVLPEGFVLPEDGKPLPMVGRGIVALLESVGMRVHWGVSTQPPAGTDGVEWIEGEEA